MLVNELSIQLAYAHLNRFDVHLIKTKIKKRPNTKRQGAPMQTSSCKKQQGFTLIELSLVLVIIGLIVGGILVGQDLIKAAEIRATVAQVEKYNSAVNTFRSKYNGLPGDIPYSQASAYGLFTLNAGVTGPGLGDGNGLIEGGAAGSLSGIGETLIFWRHLTDANLIDGALGTTGNSLLNPATGGTTGAVTTMVQSLAMSKTTPSNYFAVFAVSGVNYYELGPWTGLSTAGAYTFGTTGLTPIQAYNIDVKLDDGMPNTGAVIAAGIGAMNTAPSVAAAPGAANNCTAGTGVASDTYARIPGSGGTDPSCAMRFRFN